MSISTTFRTFKFVIDVKNAVNVISSHLSFSLEFSNFFATYSSLLHVVQVVAVVELVRSRLTLSDI